MERKKLGKPRLPRITPTSYKATYHVQEY